MGIIILFINPGVVSAANDEIIQFANCNNLNLDYLSINNGSSIKITNCINIRISNSIINASENSAIYISNSYNILIENNSIIEGNSIAIEIISSQNITISNNLIKNNEFGIKLLQSYGIQIYSNYISADISKHRVVPKTVIGIESQESSVISIHNNEFKGLNVGVLTLDVDNIILNNNSMRLNHRPVVFMATENAIISNNTVNSFSVNQKLMDEYYFGNGIEFHTGKNVNISSNYLFDGVNGFSLLIINIYNLQIQNNTIMDSPITGINTVDITEFIISSNKIVNSEDAIIQQSAFYRYNEQSIINNNYISGTENNGIGISSIENVEISSNYIENTDNFGIFVENATAIDILSNNLLHIKTSGIAIAADSKDIKIISNNFSDIGENAIVYDEGIDIFASDNLLDGKLVYPQIYTVTKRTTYPIYIQFITIIYLIRKKRVNM